MTNETIITDRRFERMQLWLQQLASTDTASSTSSQPL